MRIVLVHYHLRPGGVTQVILHQAEALREAGEEVLVLSGEAPPLAESWEGIPVTVIPGLHYDRYRPSADTTDTAESDSKRRAASLDLAKALEAAISSRWPSSGGTVLVHVHNPLIRKNSLLAGALKALAGTFPLLLQNHDLAEDFRPDVYTGCQYPENCHYAVINSRDYRFLLEAGLKPEGLHLLPNEVGTLAVTPGLPKTRYLYPVRGIRRKNIGEALLLSLYLPKADTNGKVTITQPPTTEQDVPAYRRWKETAAELRLRSEFEAGVGVSFAAVMGSAKAVITTSVKEGFGFSFLEPWTAGITVTGRRIDYVCRDFEEAGLKFDSLYRSINIPAACTEPEKLRKKAEFALSRVYAAFGLPLPPNVPAEVDRAFGSGSFFDFGIMDEELQEKVLRLTAGDKTIREQIRRANPFLENLANWQPDPRAAEANREAVLASYSRKKILVLLLETYRQTLKSVTQTISRRKLLERYLDPARLSLVGMSESNTVSARELS
ncbi:hypothetical protein AGMMS50230_08830 [Spirochaetia bacterium]|nr:hypothetical protein AGMMS50230_08830 [Spirochaetia bacterium]